MPHHVDVPEVNDMSQTSGVEMQDYSEGEFKYELTVTVAHRYSTPEDLDDCEYLE